MTMVEDHSHAGQGPVLLDIGGDVGALILTMPPSLAGREIEIRPTLPTETDGHLIHVGVLARPIAGELVHSAVFGELAQGRYELYLRPDGPVMLTETVRGGEVTLADWPS
jgi:hypothetical protein